MKKYPMMITKRQIRWLSDQFNLIGIYMIHPLEMLELTTKNPDQYEWIIHSENPRTLLRDEFEAPSVSNNWDELPRIEIVKDGENAHLVGHEGRHRAWASYKSGAPYFFIGIVGPHLLMEMPKMLTGQYRPQIQHKFNEELFVPVLS